MLSCVFVGNRDTFSVNGSMWKVTTIIEIKSQFAKTSTSLIIKFKFKQSPIFMVWYFVWNATFYWEIHRRTFSFKNFFFGSTPLRKLLCTESLKNLFGKYFLIDNYDRSIIVSKKMLIFDYNLSKLFTLVGQFYLGKLTIFKKSGRMTAETFFKSDKMVWKPKVPTL